MTRRVVLALLLLLLVACQGQGDDEDTSQPQAIPAETTVVTTTTVAPTTTAPKGLGVTQTHREEEPGYEGGTYVSKVTVFRYRDARALEPDVEADLARKGKRTVAVEVRVCITEVPPGITSYVAWEPWSLGDDQGQSYEELTSWSGDITVQPVYPDQKTTPAGTCRRGWIPFEIGRTWQPDFVEYTPSGGNPLKWPIKK